MAKSFEFQKLGLTGPLPFLNLHRLIGYASDHDGPQFLNLEIHAMLGEHCILTGQ